MGTVSRPYTYTAGDVIQPAEVTDNETTLYTLVNGNIDNDNIDSSAGIKAAKLDLASATTASFSTNVLMSLSSTITLGTTTQTIAVGSSATVTITASGGVAEIGKMTVIASATVGNLKVSGTATLGALATLGTLVVSGTATISGLVCSGTATVGDLKVSNTVTIPNLVVSGTATLGNIIASGTATLKSIVVSGTATIGDLKVSNTVTLPNLTVSGTATLGNIINSGTAITNSLLVSATTTSNSLVVSATATINTMVVTATATLNTLVVSATSTLKTIVVSGTATVGDLKVSNTVTLPRIVVSGTATIGNMIISGTATLKSIIVSGTATLGAMLVSGTATFSTVPILPDDTIETADIQDNAVTLAKMAGLARGKVIYGDASGDPAALAVGATSTVLTTDGVDISWAAVSGGTSTYASIVVSGTATLGNIKTSGTISVSATATIDHLLVNGSGSSMAHFKATDANIDHVLIESTDDGAGEGPGMAFYRNSASPAASDGNGRIRWYGNDAGGSKRHIGSVICQFTDPTTSSIDSKIYIGTYKNNAELTALTIWGSDLAVGGALSKSSGSFKIDHPLDSKKDSHHLVHSFIEGPQADLIYRGKVDLSNGSATINIDSSSQMSEGTFVELCRDVQCFTTNESGWTAIKGSVSGNTLTIIAQDNTCTDTISWMVIGERKDQHMIDNDWTDSDGKVIVEPEK